MEFHYVKHDGFTLQDALTLEWLETNGLGSYSSSTITNCHTRKYHGLLVSCINNDSLNKYVLLSKVEDFFHTNSNKFPLNTHQYAGTYQDNSFTYFTEFILKTHPTTIHELGNTRLSKEILMPYGENTVLIKYRLLSDIVDANSKIILRPLLAYRDFHSLTSENPALQNKTDICKNGRQITPYQGMPTLFLKTDNVFEFTPQPIWYKNFIYRVEQERGFPYQEDLFTPGIFTLSFNRKREIIFSFSLTESDDKLAKKWQAEINRRIKFNKKNTGTPLQRQLKKTAFSFLTKNNVAKKLSVTAGYHWFLEWGRDAMISLPGLTLYGGLEKECLAILQYFAGEERNGIIPNFLGKTYAQNAYNSVDASLWFAWAVQQYYLKTKDLNSINKTLWSPLKKIFAYYRNGTLYGIKMADNGLIFSGSSEKQNLTWMDSMVNGISAVKRVGYLVEINALWYNMLCFMCDLATWLNDPLLPELKTLIGQVKNSFHKTFWDGTREFLRDYVDPDYPDEPGSAAIRPNQIFAASLPYTPLSPKLIAKVVQTVRTHLLTPYGLRTLDAQDPNYKGTYTGNSYERDLAYHNGTVWPWLLGHFTEALLKVLKNKTKVIKILKPSLNALTNHLYEAGIGSISEIFSADAPYNPSGCISQAWSVAEILRITYLLDFK